MDVKVPHKCTRKFLRLYKACIVFFCSAVAGWLTLHYMSWAIFENMRLMEVCIALFEMPTGIFTLLSVIHGGYSMGTHWVSLIFLLQQSWQSLCLARPLGAGFMELGPCMELSMGPHSSKAQPP